jgi:catechol 2,3-dioxygenase
VSQTSETNRPSSADLEFSLAWAELRVHDLERQVRFYHDMLGLYVRAMPAGRVELSDDLDRAPIIVLAAGAREVDRLPGSPRLYHLGIRCPTREVLGTIVARLVRHGMPIEGAVDHGYAEGVYVRDAEGNRVELYADRPTNRWQTETGDVLLRERSLELNDLLQHEMLTSLPVTSGTRLGHIHLHVTNVRRSEAFYREVLGLGVSFRLGDASSFLASGTYHHHIGIDTWLEPRSDGAQDDVSGLARFRVVASGQRCKTIYRNAMEKNVHVTGQPEAFTLSDPDGFIIDVEAG